MAKNAAPGAKEKRSAIGSVMLRFRELCQPRLHPKTLHPPGRGDEFEPGTERILANLLSLLGWDNAAEFFVETDDTRGFLWEQVLTVPRAVDGRHPTDLLILFEAPKNNAVMFKRIEIVPANCNTGAFGEVIFAESGDDQKLRPTRMEQMIGTVQARGRVVMPQSVVREDEGTMGITLRNHDPFAIARFKAEFYGWLIER